MTDAISPEAVRQRAHELWEAAGRPKVDPLEFVSLATQELRLRAAQYTLKVTNDNHDQHSASPRRDALEARARNVKAVIFDVDGTLIDSVDAHAAAWQAAFEEFGHAVPLANVRSQIGKGGDQLLPMFLSDDAIQQHGATIEQRRAAILKERYRDGLRGFPGVRDLFVRLHADGIQTVLASSAKGEELAFYKRRADIADLIAAETSSDDAARSKPHADIFEAAIARIGALSREQMIVVGDTPYDAEAAGKAGLRTVGVLCGGFPEADLRTAGCCAIFRDPADMLHHYHALPFQ